MEVGTLPIGARFVFEPFELDPDRRRLTAAGEPVAISERQLDVLLALVARGGQIISKEELLQAGWKDVAVGDNSLEQAISGLRRLLGARHIETVPRRGYRFGVPVTRMPRRESDAGLDALLAPHRAFIEGRAALETLEGDRVPRAREVFETTLRSAPDYASAHIGLANACVMQFEMTRADLAPDTASLALAAHHAREACRLDPQSGEAWATLGFVLDRTGNGLDARAASKRAVTLEPDNWRHHFRLSYVSWGEERLRAAHRTLALLPGFPLAHWLAASVHVARQTLSEAERELAAGLTPQAGQSIGGSRFSPVALHWLLGLIHLANGDETGALEEFERELSFESAGQLYSRECAANTWYAVGALRLRQRRPADAGAAFTRAIERVPAHRMARVGLAALGSLDPTVPQSDTVDAAMLRAAQLVTAGEHDVHDRHDSHDPHDARDIHDIHSRAARIVGDALAGATAGNAGWLLPIEPLLHVTAHADIWAHALAHLRNRAA